MLIFLKRFYQLLFEQKKNIISDQSIAQFLSVKNIHTTAFLHLIYPQKQQVIKQEMIPKKKMLIQKRKELHLNIIIAKKSILYCQQFMILLLEQKYIRVALLVLILFEFDLKLNCLPLIQFEDVLQSKLQMFRNINDKQRSIPKIHKPLELPVKLTLDFLQEEQSQNIIPSVKKMRDIQSLLIKIKQQLKVQIDILSEEFKQFIQAFSFSAIKSIKNSQITIQKHNLISKQMLFLIIANRKKSLFLHYLMSSNYLTNMSQSGENQSQQNSEFDIAFYQSSGQSFDQSRLGSNQSNILPANISQYRTHNNYEENRIQNNYEDNRSLNYHQVLQLVQQKIISPINYDAIIADHSQILQQIDEWCVSQGNSYNQRINECQIQLTNQNNTIWGPIQETILQLQSDLKQQYEVNIEQEKNFQQYSSQVLIYQESIHTLIDRQNQRIEELSNTIEQLIQKINSPNIIQSQIVQQNQSSKMDQIQEKFAITIKKKLPKVKLTKQQLAEDQEKKKEELKARNEKLSNLYINLDKELILNLKKPWKFLETKRDGNCFYRAIQKCLGNNEDQYQEIKTLVSKWVISNRLVYNEQLVGLNLNNLIQSISTEGKYAGEGKIRTTSECLGMCIIVHFQHPKNTETKPLVFNSAFQVNGILEVVFTFKQDEFVCECQNVWTHKSTFRSLQGLRNYNGRFIVLSLMFNSSIHLTVSLLQILFVVIFFMSFNGVKRHKSSPTLVTLHKKISFSILQDFVLRVLVKLNLMLAFLMI